MTRFEDKIAKMCFDFFETLPKSGKPKETMEWTVLACIIKSNNNDYDIVSLGTGSKCIGVNQMSPNGDILNDCHAEIIARRGFLRYLYEQAELTYQSKESIFDLDINRKLNLKNSYKFHLFSTQCPCGDITNIENSKIRGTELVLKRPTIDSNIESSKRAKLYDGTFVSLTGAKNILKSHHCEDVVLGQVCIKPGKGDPTASLSCSDKIARWLRLGLQGALLDMVLTEPIFLHSITIAGGCPFSLASFYRGLVDRSFMGDYKGEWDTLRKSHSLGDNTVFELPVIPCIGQSRMEFKFAKFEDGQPCSSSIVWCKVVENPLQVAVAGKKQGTTKKNKSAMSSSLLISKYYLLKTFLSVYTLKEFPAHSLDIPINENYKNIKKLSKRYYETWEKVKKEIFSGIWSNKPDLLNFTVCLKSDDILKSKHIDKNTKHMTS